MYSIFLAQVCVDDPRTTFIVNKQGGGTEEVGCGYIKQAGISNQQSLNRQTRWCSDDREDNVADSCRKSCGTCASSSCTKDTDNYSFEVWVSDSEKGYVPCSWIYANGITNTQLSRRIVKNCIVNEARANHCCRSCEIANDKFYSGGVVNAPSPAPVIYESYAPSVDKISVRNAKTQSPVIGSGTNGGGSSPPAFLIAGGKDGGSKNGNNNTNDPKGMLMHHCCIIVCDFIMIIFSLSFYIIFLILTRSRSICEASRNF